MPIPAGSSTDRRASLVGSLWMVAAMAGFAVEDSLVKGVTARLPVAEVLVVFGLGGALVFAAVATWRREGLFKADVLSCASASRSRAGCSTRWRWRSRRYRRRRRSCRRRRSSSSSARR